MSLCPSVFTPESSNTLVNSASTTVFRCLQILLFLHVILLKYNFCLSWFTYISQGVLANLIYISPPLVLVTYSAMDALYAFLISSVLLNMAPRRILGCKKLPWR
ncbi:hypothetical protein BDD12DRAFT_106937 [Trichophaea hybrida]|nr:hypothetical protein BDD12DRAFT_106937 [Trichophaea hybrida]